MEDIHPAPYVGRYKWVMLDRLNALGYGELKDLIAQSYEMVAAKAPKLKQKPSRGKRSRKKAISKRNTVPRRRI